MIDDSDMPEFLIENDLEIVACGGNGADCVNIPLLLLAAADEIRRLRKEVEKYSEAYSNAGWQLTANR